MAHSTTEVATENTIPMFYLLYLAPPSKSLVTSVLELTPRDILKKYIRDQASAY